MLQLVGVRAAYGNVEVLRGVDLVLEPARVLGLLGRNGAGKTTTIRAIMGLVDGLDGSIRIEGTELVGLPAHRIPGHGICVRPARTAAVPRNDGRGESAGGGTRGGAVSSRIGSTSCSTSFRS